MVRATEGTTPSKASFTYITKTLLCGGVAGCCAKTFIAPMERVKILFQASNPHFSHLTGTYSGPFRALYSIVQREGVAGMWKGNSATLARVFPYAAIQYMSYEQFKRLLNLHNEKEKPITRLFAGSLAGLVSVIATYPLDLIRARIAFQVTENKYRNLFHALSTRYYHEGGVYALYRGFGATAMGIIPYAGVSFYTYETLKSFFKNHFPQYSMRDEKELNVTTRLLCGAIAGASGQTVAYPLDVIRRRMQVEGLSSETYAYKNTVSACKQIFAKEGMKGFFVGLSINYIKVGPMVGISFVVYEYMKKQLGILDY